jgi:hypothetical protein
VKFQNSFSKSVPYANLFSYFVVKPRPIIIPNSYYFCKKNKVNNIKKIAKENFENNLDHILLENSSNPKTYWKIMKMLIKSNKGNSINDENFDDIVYGDEDKCDLLNKYFSLISKLNFLSQFFSCYLLYFSVFYIV